MRELYGILKRFVPPYKKYLVASVVFNILSALLNVFSFGALIPILQILFQTDQRRVTALMEWGSGNIKDVLSNNVDYHNTAPHRSLPGIHHLPKDRGLFPLVGIYNTHPHGNSERHTQSVVSQNHLTATRILLGGAQGRHHSTHERRCG